MKINITSEIINLVRDYRFINRVQIEDLLILKGVKFNDRYLRTKLKNLTEEQYLKRSKNSIYSYYIYALDIKGYQFVNEKINRSIYFGSQNLKHEMLVADSTIFLCKFYNYKINESEVEEHFIRKDLITIDEQQGLFKDEIKQKFAIQKQHAPDIIFSNVCVEVELSRKKFSRVKMAIMSNKKNYQKQIWIIYKYDFQLENFILNVDENIQIIYVEEIIKKLERNKIYL